MGREFFKAFDQCFAWIKRGGAVGECWARYPHLRERLEPLLRIAVSIWAAPKVVPANEFRKMSRDRLIARLREESARANDAKPVPETGKRNALIEAWQRLMSPITNPRKLAVAIAAVLLVAFGGGFFAVASPAASAPSSALAPNCTLSVVAGMVEIQSADSTIWQEGVDGMALENGDRVKTAPQSMALLAFFEGSTLELEANTEVEIDRVEYVEKERTVIIVKQWLGTTWSRVVELTHPGSCYEIQTPSACAFVRGTSFVTTVNDTGSTQVFVAEGLVTVAAQGVEASVPAGHEVGVESGSAPSQPTASTGPPGQSDVGPPGQGPEGDGPPGQSDVGPPGQGPEGDGPPGQSDVGPPGQTRP